MTTHTQHDIGDGARKDFVLPMPASITAVKVNTVDAGHTVIRQNIVRLNTAAPQDAAVDITFTMLDQPDPPYL